MAVTTAEFKIDFPQFSSTSDPLIERFLTKAANRISASVYGALYNDAQGYLAAHLLTVAERGKQSGGAVTTGIRSKSITGHYSVDFAVAEGSDIAGSSSYQSTAYGREFLNIQCQVVVPVRIL